MARATPAQRLEGVSLPNGWTVKQRLELGEVTTGGHFSEAYIVESVHGERAFLKAFDYSAALAAPDPASTLKALTESFVFERDLLRRCRDRKCDRVVTSLDDGIYRLAGESQADVVQYIVLELAEGDLRIQASKVGGLDAAWLTRSLHHIATGLSQLHGDGVAHQDLKPSNVLVFEGGGSGDVSKVADLGRAAWRGHEPPPHDDLPVPGDRQYAPPELLYGHVEPEWQRRRLGCDAYHLGSMIYFCFVGSGMTEQIQAVLPESLRWRNWGGTYGDVLPYLRDALGRVLARFPDMTPSEHGEELKTFVRQLCEPDPELRGHPKQRWSRAGQYALARYISRLDLLARRIERVLQGR